MPEMSAPPVSKDSANRSVASAVIRAPLANASTTAITFRGGL
jgi:hypothetical protein